MNTEINEVEINGVKYIRKDSANQFLPTTKDGYCIVRCVSAGVFFGMVKSCNLEKGVATILNARRIWYWSGAASLSQLAVDGTTKPTECKFPCSVERIEVAQVIEVIPVTQKSFDSLNSVKVWKQ